MNPLEIKNKLNELINLLENKPGFFFASNHSYSFRELQCFLYGYLTCLDEFNRASLNLHFSKWINDKHTKTALSWHEYIYIVMADNDDKQAIEILFREFRLYINSIEIQITQ